MEYIVITEAVGQQKIIYQPKDSLLVVMVPTGDFLMSQGQDSSRRADSVTFSLGGSPATGPSVSSGRYSPTSSVACSGSANGVVFGWRYRFG